MKGLAMIKPIVISKVHNRSMSGNIAPTKFDIKRTPSVDQYQASEFLNISRPRRPRAVGMMSCMMAETIWVMANIRPLKNPAPNRAPCLMNIGVFIDTSSPARGD